MATLDEVLEKVGQSCIVSKLDLAKGFYQIPLAESAMDKTAFITPFGNLPLTDAFQAEKLPSSVPAHHGRGVG